MLAWSVPGCHSSPHPPHLPVPLPCLQLPACFSPGLSFCFCAVLLKNPSSHGFKWLSHLCCFVGFSLWGGLQSGSLDMVSEVQVSVWDGGECPWEEPPYPVKEAVLVQLRTGRNPHPGDSGLCMALQGPPESGWGPGPLYLSGWQSLRLAVIEAPASLWGAGMAGAPPLGSHPTSLLGKFSRLYQLSSPFYAPPGDFGSVGQWVTQLQQSQVRCCFLRRLLRATLFGGGPWETGFVPPSQ